MGSPQGTVLQELLQCRSLPQTTENLLLCGFCMARSFIQGMSACSSVGILHGLQSYSLLLVFCRVCRAISALVSGAPPPIPSPTGVLLLFSFVLFCSPLFSPSGILPFLRCVSLRHHHHCTQGARPHPTWVCWNCPCLCSPGISSQRLPNSQRLTSDTLGCVGCLKSYCQITWKKPRISNYLWYVKPLFGKSYRFPAGAF